MKAEKKISELQVRIELTTLRVLAVCFFVCFVFINIIPFKLLLLRLPEAQETQKWPIDKSYISSYTTTTIFIVLLIQKCKDIKRKKL